MSDSAEHWELVYEATPSTGVSWYEREPTMSVRLIERTNVGTSAVVIDVGAGTSALVDHLVAGGYSDVTVLDVSGRALGEVRERLGERANDVVFIEDDLLSWEPNRHYDLWHDRAVFHFLTDRRDRERYRDLVGKAVRSGGWVVLATFASGGPTQCSGLAVSRYSAEELAEVFAAEFALIEAEQEEHLTPAGVAQPFTWVVLRHK